MRFFARNPRLVHERPQTLRLAEHIESHCSNLRRERIRNRALPMTNNISIERDGNVVRVTLNRPERLNAMTVELLAELRAAADSIAGDQSVRVAIITGAGRGFCAGADLTAHDQPTEPNQTRGDRTRDRLDKHFNPTALAWYELPVPVIAAVNGVAAGAGVSLALTADIVVAARSASFIQVFAPKLGLIPDAGATFHVPRLIGAARAKGLALLGEKLSAERAAEWGLIWECVDDDMLMATVNEYARTLAAGPTRAFAAVKSIYNASTGTLREQMAIEAKVQGELANGEDFAEGVAAFLQKRPAQFKGR
jgi:2-(1,2-epoxy-1,2-dihydrophenyl)acetyl-CoA isomerase